MELFAHLSISIRIVRSDPMFILSPWFINSGVLQSVAAETMFLSVRWSSKGPCTIHIPLIADWPATTNEDFYISSCNNWIIDHPDPCILLTAAPPRQSELDICPRSSADFDSDPVGWEQFRCPFWKLTMFGTTAANHSCIAALSIVAN